jgi:hypothetical protein
MDLITAHPQAHRFLVQFHQFNTGICPALAHAIILIPDRALVRLHIITTVPGRAQPTSANLQLPCDHERALGGCTGLAMKGALGVRNSM